MTDDFAARMERATGLTLADMLILGKAEAERRAELIRAAGHCCEAGMIAYPDPCPWHAV